MTKTVWFIVDEMDGVSTELTYYHFGKEPQFPAWYLEANHLYTIEMLWNLNLVVNFKTFFKCLTHSCIIK